MVEFSPLWALAQSLLAAPLCAWQARSRGHSASLWASIGLMLGAGSLPLCWVLTQEQERTSGQGLTPAAEPSPTGTSSTSLILGTALICVPLSLALQSLVYLLPITFQQSPQDYDQGIPPRFQVAALTLVWMAINGVLPLLCAKILQRRSLQLLHAPLWLAPALSACFFYTLWIAAELFYQWLLYWMNHLG